MSSEEQAYELRDGMGHFLQAHLIPALENYFEEWDTHLDTHSLQITALASEVSLSGGMDLSQWKETIVQAVEKDISDRVTDTTSKGALILSETERDERTVLHFLKTGQGPWWNTEENKHIPTIIDPLIEPEISSHFREQLKRILRLPKVRDRLVMQFDDVQIKTLLRIIVTDKTISGNSLQNITNVFRDGVNNPWRLKDEAIRSDSLQRITNILKDGVNNSGRLEGEQRRRMWHAVIHAFLGEDIESKQLIKRILITSAKYEKPKDLSSIAKVDAYVKDHNWDELLHAMENKSRDLLAEVVLYRGPLDQQTEESAGSSELSEAVEKSTQTDQHIPPLRMTKEEAIHHIGESDMPSEASLQQEATEDLRVSRAGLILLHPFLKELFGHCGLLDEASEITDPEKAAHLLHFLATGEQHAWEHQMTFEKYICNIPIGQPIPRDIDLSEGHKEQVTLLLRSALKHWPKMEDASVDLFRNEFLQRAGKLVPSGEQPRVIVERKTQDVLLEKIPWNLYMVKFPWKKKIIVVDW